MTPGRLDAGRERVVDRARARELRQQRRVDVHDPPRGSGRGTRREQVHVAGADDQLDASAPEPVRHRRVALLAVGVVVEVERARGERRPRRPARAPGARPIEATAPTGSRASRSAWRFEPSPLTRTPITRPRSPDHERRLAGGDDGAVADAEVEDAAELLLLDVLGEPPEDRRPLQASQSISARRPSGRTRRRFPPIPPPVTCAKAHGRPRAVAEPRRDRAASARAGHRRRSPTARPGARA